MFQVNPVNPDNFVQKKNSMHNMLLDISDNSIECCVSNPPPPTYSVLYSAIKSRSICNTHVMCSLLERMHII